jgi:hypothetical protein
MNALAGTHAWIEPLAFALVCVWLALRFRREHNRPRLALQLVSIAIAAWIGEMTCVRFTHFYAYASVWRVFVDVVPLAVVCIWPIVIRSSLDLVVAVRPLPETAATPSLRGPWPWRHALAVGALVTLDASIIEPIAVHTGLWWWTEPGPFDVPLIGVLGWGVFAFFCVLFSLRANIIAFAPALMHVALLALWWGALKWLPSFPDAEPVLVALAVTGSLIAAVVFARGTRAMPSRSDVVSRAPAAAFFFVLLAVYCRDAHALIAYAIAFAPPWLVLVARAR